jgi:hypothetical protein
MTFARYIVGFVGVGLALYLVVLIGSIIFGLAIGRYDVASIGLIAVSIMSLRLVVWGTRKLWRWLGRTP